MVPLLWLRYVCGAETERSRQDKAPRLKKFSVLNANVYHLSAVARLASLRTPVSPSQNKFLLFLEGHLSRSSGCSVTRTELPNGARLCQCPCPGGAAQPGAIALSPPGYHLDTSCHVNLVWCNSIRASGGKCIRVLRVPSVDVLTRELGYMYQEELLPQ